jgi:predicted nicotinamide N-methyase
MAAEAKVWIADPGRAYVPADGLEEFAHVSVPTTMELEDRTERTVRLFRLGS